VNQDYYQILGVPPDALPEAIRAAFRRRARECHPDCGGSHEAMLLVNEAWEVLSDGDRRRRYDETSAGQAGEPVREAAEADRQGARRRAEEYPRRWADYEAWLNRVAGDFAGARYAKGSGPFALPEINNSVSGTVFVVAGMAVGALLLPLLTGGAAGNGKMMWVFGAIGGAWLGALAHKAVGDRLRQRGERASTPPSAEAGRIVPCERCDQKLRVPRLSDDIVVTCRPCGHRFTVRPAAEETKVADSGQGKLTIPDGVACGLLLVGALLVFNLMDGCAKKPKDPWQKLRDIPRTAPVQ
jgi:hypothetical protein